MRRLAVVLLLCGMTGCGMSLPKLHVGAGASAVIPEESTLENTYMIDFFARIDIASLQAELSVGWKTYDYKVDLDGDGTFDDEGELDVKPVAATLRWVTGPAAVRLVAGGGIVWNINTLEDIGTLKVDDSVGYRAVLGAEIKVIQDFKITIEAIYDFNEADIEGVIVGDEVDTSGLTGRIAFSYNF